MKYKLIWFAGLMLTFTACVKNEKVNSIEKAKWLEGTWQGNTNGGLTYFEKWQVVNDTLMRNINYHISGTDTVVGGKSELRVSDGQLVYVNYTKNGEQKWHTTKFNNLEMEFENNAVSHAQKISFFKTAPDKWEAALYGQKDTMRYILNKIN